MPRPVQLIGVPTDFGVDRRGVDMGPSAIRYAGLAETLEAAGIECTDGGNVPVPVVEEVDEPGGPGRVRYLDETKTVTERVADRVAEAIADGGLPLVLGGDHSIAIGSLAGSARNADVGLVWFDAHGDYNTPGTTPSGNVHGMPVAAALGAGGFAEEPWAHADGLRAENVAWVGLRDVDDAEADAIRESAATAFTMADIDERGVTAVVEAALDVAADGVDGIHVSLDLDWLDPHEAPGVGTPVRGGVTYREAHAALESVASFDDGTGVLRSMDLVEVNPILDDRNETAALACELAASALGKRIL
ncbi:MAG: arginase [Halobacteriales archaeon]